MRSNRPNNTCFDRLFSVVVAVAVVALADCDFGCALLNMVLTVKGEGHAEIEKTSKYRTYILICWLC